MRNSIRYVPVFVLAVTLTALVFCINRSLGAEEKPAKGVGTQKGETEVQSEEEGMSRRININFRNMDVVDALRFLAGEGGLNIVVSKTVAGRCTLYLDKITIRDVFDILLLSNLLAYVKKGDVYYVMTDKEYKVWYGERFADTRELRVFRLKYAIPGKAFTLIDALKSEIGKVIVDEESGTVLIMDTPAKIKEMEKSLTVLEQEVETVVFNLNYAKAKDVEDQLKPQLDDKKAGTIKADERSNQVIVQGLPGRIENVKRVIDALDKKTLQVMIDARIIKMLLSDTLDAKFEWEGLFSYLTQHHGAVFLGSHPFESMYRMGETYVGDYTKIAPTTAPTAATKTTLTENIYVTSVGAQKYEGVIKFLQTLGDMRVISNPKLSVINNQEAKIHVGTREAYITTTTTTGQTTSTITEEVTFVDTGILLSVTPTINEEGYITMKIAPEISSVVDYLITPSGNKIPIIDTSIAETTVMAKDNTTIIIGGLRREEEQKRLKQVPFLGRIPLLGNLFKSQTKDKVRGELLVMITPRLVSGDVLVTGKPETKEEMIKPFKDYKVAEGKDEEKVVEFKPYLDYDEPYEMDGGGI